MIDGKETLAVLLISAGSASNHHHPEDGDRVSSAVMKQSFGS